MDIIALKLVTGEDILGENVNKGEDIWTLKNPVGITIVRGQDGKPNIGFSPFPLHAEQKTGLTVAIAKRNVVYSYEPAEDFKSNYDQIFGSGLIVPKQQSIITG